MSNPKMGERIGTNTKNAEGKKGMGSKWASGQRENEWGTKKKKKEIQAQVQIF